MGALLIAIAMRPPRNPSRASPRKPLLSLCFYFIDVQRAAGRHTAADLNMLPDLARDCSRIVDRKNLLVLIRHEHRFLTRLEALLGAGGVSGIGALGPAFRVTDPPRHARIF